MTTKGICPGCGRKGVVLQWSVRGDDVCRQCLAREQATVAKYTVVLTVLTPSGNIGRRQWVHGLSFAEASGVVGSTLASGKACEAWLYRDDVEWAKGSH